MRMYELALTANSQPQRANGMVHTAITIENLQGNKCEGSYHNTPGRRRLSSCGIEHVADTAT